MKNLKFLLLACLSVVLIDASAQISLEKRHHMKGYNLDVIKKEKKNNFTISAGERVTAAEVGAEEAKVEAIEQPVTEVRTEAHSAFVEFSNSQVPTAATIPAIAAENNASNGVSDKALSFVRKGAGLVLSKKMNNVVEKQLTKKRRGRSSGSDTFAIIGFVCGCLAFVGLFLGYLSLLAIPGLIFSIVGLSSGDPLAKWGVILNGVVLLLFILLIVLLASIFL